MKFNPDIHHRRSIRIKGYDYSKDGLYFITICTENRECILSKIKEDVGVWGALVDPENTTIRGSCRKKDKRY